MTALGLSYQSSHHARLADGSTRLVDSFEAEIEWDGFWRSVLVTEVDTTPLVGTELLAGHEMYVEFRTGGAVDITRLP